MNRFKGFSFLLLWLLNGLVLHAQTPEEYQKKFLYGKELLKENRYQAAAQVFLPLTTENSSNAFSKTAAYLYAFSSLKSGELEAAKSMCLQTLLRYPDWEQKDEVYYLLANAYFEQKKPRLALQFLYKTDRLKKDGDNIKQHYLPSVEPLDTLIALQNDYPADAQLAQILAKRLAAFSLNEKNSMLLNFLIQEYKLNIRSLSDTYNSVLKTNYRIALLLPFQLNEIDPKSNKRSNQYVLDLYEGIKLAVDSLRTKGINVTLYTYDTEKEPAIVQSILSLPEFKSMDLIIGPVFPVQIPLVTEFSKKNNIININPFSANSKIIEHNLFTYLYQPTLEWQAGNAARYASANFRYDSSFVHNYTPPRNSHKFKEKPERQKVIIFYGNELRDSLLASYHKDSCKSNGLNVIHFEKITRDRIGLLKTILNDTLKLGQCNHVFVSSSDEVVAANIMSLIEISRQNTPLLTRSDWLSFNLIAFEQYEKRNVFFLHQDYYDYSNPVYKNFKTAYVQRAKLYPSPHALQGFELMMFFGQALGEYGTYFKSGLDISGFRPGIICEGFDYRYSFTNRYLPITRFRDKNLVLVNNIHP
jgi:hypothetical protein